MSSLTEQAAALLNLIPEKGAIGNVTLRKNLYATFDFSEGTINPTYEGLKAELLAAGIIKLGRGKGGSVRRIPVSSVSEIRAVVEQLKKVSLAPDENGNFTMYPQPGSPLFGKTQEEAEEIIGQISYPTGSLGEHVPDATGDSSGLDDTF